MQLLRELKEVYGAGHVDTGNGNNWGQESAVA